MVTHLHSRVGHGPLFQTPIQSKILDPTQPNSQKSSHDPTQLIIDPVSEMIYTVSSGTLNPSIPYHTIPYHTIIATWYGILGYTESFIQQLLPYIQLVDYIRQVNCQ